MLDAKFMPERGYNDEDMARAMEISKAGAVAFFLYYNRVLKQGESHRLCENDPTVRTVGSGGAVMLPISAFSEHLGCEVKKQGGGYLVKRAGREIFLSEKNEAALSVAPKFTESSLYVPLYECAIFLGFSARVAFFDRLVVIGEEEVISAIDSNEALVNAMAYAVFGERSDEAVTAEDYKRAKEKYRLTLVGSPEINDLSDPFIQNKVKSISNKCLKKWESMNKGEGINLLWGDHKPELSEELSIQYNSILALAMGWGTYGSDYYHNEELLSDILFAIKWMYENMYGEAEMRNEGWRDIYAFNWWHWHSGAINPLTDTLLILEENVPIELRRTYTKCYDVLKQLMPYHRPSSKILTKIGILCEQPEKFGVASHIIENGLKLSDLGQARHTDYLDFAHGFPHNISYGALLLTNHLTAVSAVAGTALDYSNPHKYNLFELFKYMYEPAIFNGRGFVMFSGRQVQSSEKGTSYGAPPIIANLLGLIGVFGEEEDYYLKCFIKRNVKGDEQVIKNVVAVANFLNLSILKEILEDASIPDKIPYEYAHVWYTGDRVSQQRNNYAIALALSSRRIFTYESINDQNKTGWYTGDGSTYIYTDYDDASFDGANFTHQNIEVAYHFPGTTEDEQPRVARSIANAHAWRNPTDFSGGVQFKKKFVTAGMEFIAMNYDGPDDKEDRGYGGGLVPHKNDLKAKKAYFCFDKETICLGAGITSTMDSPVNTTIEHKRIIREEEFSQFVDGELLPKSSFVREYEDAKAFLMEGHAGFVLLSDSRILVRRYVSETADNQPFMECRICHGKNPSGASYAYAIVPYATADSISEYAKNPDVEIISNTPSLQAVRHKKLDCLGIVFHEPGECMGVRVDTPCFVMLDCEELRVSEPSGKASSITVTLDGERKISSLDEKMTVFKKDSKTVIEIDAEGRNGKPFGLRF